MHLLEETGCFALVLEKSLSLAERVARDGYSRYRYPGAGGAVGGQVLVVSDMLGMTNGFSLVSSVVMPICIRLPEREPYSSMWMM